MTLISLEIQLNQLQLNKTFINIDFNNSPVDFWRFANFSRHNKIPSHIIFEQALEKGLIEDSKKNLLERFIKFIKENSKDFKSQLYQDIFAAFIVKDKYEKTFLEFGATNGIHLSNSYTLENNFLWSGVLSEPDPQWFDELKKNRPKTKILNKCIWKKSGEKINFFSSKTGVFSTIDEFKYSDQTSMPGNSNKRNEAGTNLEVETISLNDVIESEFSGNCPSYISVDTEGSEFEILRSLNFKKYRPILFTVEHNFTNMQSEIDKLMLENNYVRVFNKLTLFDAWYVSADVNDKF